MSTTTNTAAWDCFLTHTSGDPDQVPVALIVDIPGWQVMGSHPRLFSFSHQWGQINLESASAFPRQSGTGLLGRVWHGCRTVAFGCKMRFYPDRPPSIEPSVPDLSFWEKADPHQPRMRIG